MKIMVLAAIFCALPILQGCGSASGSSAGAVVLASPQVGYACFGIRNDAGEIVGGNCVKE